MAVNFKNCVEHVHCVDSSNIKLARKVHSLFNLFVLVLFIYLFIYFNCSNFLIFLITGWNSSGSSHMIFIADRTSITPLTGGGVPRRAKNTIRVMVLSFRLKCIEGVGNTAGNLHVATSITLLPELN